MKEQATKRPDSPVVIMVEGALAIAIAFALSWAKLELPLWFQGGSVNLVMVPLVVFAVRRGAGQGVLAGLVFGTIKFFLAGGFALGWQSILLDYTLAYAAVGLAGLFKNSRHSYALGAVAGGAARFVVHYISGVTIYAMYMPESFMNMTMTTPWIYSALYNGAYMLPSTLIAVVACVALQKPLSRLGNH